MNFLKDASTFRSHVLRSLERAWRSGSLFPDEVEEGATSSSVMLLLGYQAVSCPNSNGAGSGSDDICIILNKRSRTVRQAGDLCCPGGSVEPEFDPRLAKLLSLPGLPLSLWPYWSDFRRNRPQDARLLSLLLATSLRESWEEMGVNPLLFRFLGPLPYKNLEHSPSIIHPMVGWIFLQKRFAINSEVEKVVIIPLRSLLDRMHYARFRLYVPTHLEKKFNRTTTDHPCFIHEERNHTELLWGATYRIVCHFLELIFGFIPPDLESLPMVPGLYSEGYFAGRPTF